MSFEKTKNAISYLEKQRSLTSYDIFNLFHNICDDAEEVTREKLEKIDCRSTPEDDLAAALMWCSKKIVRVINKNKENISDPFYLNQLTKEVKKVNECITMLENETAQTQELFEKKIRLCEQENAKKIELAKIEADNQKKLEAEEQQACKNLEAEKKKLMAAKQQLDDKIAEKDKLQADCRRLQAVIDRAENVNIPELENKKLELSGQEAKLQDKIQNLKTELSGMDATIAELKDDRKNLAVEMKLKNSEVESLKRKCSDLDDDITELKKQITELENDVKNKKADYEIEKAGLEQLGSKQRELIEMIRKLREDQSELNIEILTIRKAQEEMEYVRKKREYDEKEKMLAEEHQKHQQEYKALEEAWEKKKQAELQDIEEKKQELEDKKNVDMRKIQQEISSVETKRKECMAELQQKLNEQEAKKQQILLETQAKKEEIEEASKSVTDAIAKKEQVILEATAAKTQAEIDRIATKEKAELEAIEKQKKAINDKIEARNTKIAEEKEKQQKLEDDFANKSLELNKAMEETKEKFAMVKAALDTLEKRKKNLNIDLNDTSREREKLEKWFAGIEAAQKEDALATLRTQVMILQEAKQKLDDEFHNKYYMDGDKFEEQMVEYRVYFANTLMDVEKMLDEYCRKYAIVSEIVYKGGKM